MVVRGLSYVLAIIFWLVTAFYALLASQDFIYQQFLRPELVPPLAWFARYWAAGATAIGVLWFVPRGTPAHRPHFSTWLTTIVWATVAAAAWLGYGLAALTPGHLALASALAATLVLVPMAIAERPDALAIEGETRPRTAADFCACLLAAIVVAAIDAAIGLLGDQAFTTADAWMAARGPLLAGMGAFLVLTLVRATGGMFERSVVAEARATAVALGVVIGWFLAHMVLPSISIVGWVAAAGAYLAGGATALAITVCSGARLDDPDDGVASVLGSLAPRVAGRVPGFAAWCVVLSLLAFGMHRVTQATDWNSVGARLGMLIVGLMVLGGARRLVRMPGDGEPAVFLGFALMVLAADAGLARMVPPHHRTAQTPGARWTADLLAARSGGPSALFDLLPLHTNIPGSRAVAPVLVNWAEFSGPPAAERPDIYVFVIDSLRRDYLSPYNPAVTFTPAIDAFAKESLVFQRAFTQYGATGLSVPSIWVGGPVLHNQYVTPFAPMNALARLLTHEQYAEWISMDNILEVILPVTPALAPLDARRPVREFRMCRTLEEVRGRLAVRQGDQPPVFTYSLPQDLHVSVIAREGGRAVDEGRYGGFYAPVASRIRRFDTCLGAFVDDLKARGRYDKSIIVLTSDHGDSLGEDRRVGHAYTLYPEIVRVPLIVHVPTALRDRYAWDTARPAYTTDLAPTLFRLLGHEPVPPHPFFGESLASLPGTTRPPAPDRMVAASYGSVYGALLENATRLYVADAIHRREMAFEISDGPGPGTAIPVTPAIRREGEQVIRSTVEGLARQYQFTAPPR